MKVVLTGSSGFIGGEALKQCVADDRTDQVVILVRRQPPAGSLPTSPKITTVIVNDFNNYDKDTLAAIADADAAIWAMGTKYSGDPVVEIEYPTTFYKAIVSSDSFQRRSTPFRFSYLGGAFTVPDQERSLWLLAVPRKSRGLAQTTVLGFADAEESRGKWVTHVIRPGGVFPAAGEANLFHKLTVWGFGPGLAAWNDEVGLVLVKLAVEGGEERVVSSRRVSEIAREVKGA